MRNRCWIYSWWVLLQSSFSGYLEYSSTSVEAYSTCYGFCSSWESATPYLSETARSSPTLTRHHSVCSMNPTSPLHALPPKESSLSDRADTLQPRSIQDSVVQDLNVQDLSAQDRSMHSEQICPCCSNILLRHVSNSRIYWRCGYCYQEMPVMEDYSTPPL